MKHLCPLLGLITMLSSCCTPNPSPAPRASSSAPGTTRFTYVIVHGAWGGGWAFREVDRQLTAAGHKVYRPTLTGLGERVHLATTNINLSTHIQDVVNVLRYEELTNVVLVGHSYGGMVVTGVADRAPDRIRHLIYLDAIVPENGESAYISLGNPGGSSVSQDSFVIPPWLNTNRPPPADVPHPAATFIEPLTLKAETTSFKGSTTYVLTVDPGQQPQSDMFHRFYERAKARGWKTVVLEADHNPQWSAPKALVELLQSAPQP
jgi:pimeloyl-ACP methyl ester carboxylesterase